MQTYDELVKNVLRTLEDESEEFVTFIGDAIFLAEERVIHNTDYMRFDENVVTNSTNTEGSPQTATVGGVVLPTGNSLISSQTVPVNSDSFLYFKHVFYRTETGLVKLEKVDISFVHEINTMSNRGRNPRYYAHDRGDPTKIYFAPRPSSSTFQGLDILFTRKPQKLSPSNQTNELLVKAPDLMRTAVVCEMYKFAKKWDTLALWETNYQNLLQAHLRTSGKERKDVGEAHLNTSTTDQSNTRV